MRDGWRATTIGEVAEVVGGSTPKTGVGAYWGGDIPWITPSEVTRQEGGVITATDRMLTQAGLASIGNRLLPAATVLLTSRATIGAVALAGVPMAVNQGFAALIAGPDVDPRWLAVWCQAHRPDFERLAGGSTYPEISRPKVRDVPLDLPPLAEQRRIVDLVASLDVHARLADAVAVRAADARSSYVRDVLSATVPVLPLDRVAIVAQGSALPMATQGSREGGTPWFKIADMGRSENTWGYRVADTTVDEGTIRSLGGRVLPVGTVVFPRVGGAVLTERKRRLDVAGAVDENHLAVVPGPSLLPGYLIAWMEQVQLTSLVRNGAVPSLNQGLIRGLRLPVPDIDRQSQIASVADGLRVAEEGASLVAVRSRVMRSALLADLLSGDHEIPTSYDRFLDGAA